MKVTLLDKRVLSYLIRNSNKEGYISLKLQDLCDAFNESKQKVFYSLKKLTEAELIIKDVRGKRGLDIFVSNRDKYDEILKDERRLEN